MAQFQTKEIRDALAPEDSHKAEWVGARAVVGIHAGGQISVVDVSQPSSLKDERLMVDSDRVERIKHELAQLQSGNHNPAPYFSAEKEAFLDTLVEEATHMQRQGHMGVIDDEEQPLFAGGLIPSADGLRWRETEPEPAMA